MPTPAPAEETRLKVESTTFQENVEKAPSDQLGVLVGGMGKSNLLNEFNRAEDQVKKVSALNKEEREPSEVAISTTDGRGSENAIKGSGVANTNLTVQNSGVNDM